MFDTELSFFIANQDDLVKKHRGKVLVIRGERVEGVYENAMTAYLAAMEQFDPGTFALQPCEPGPGAYTVTIN